jgi:[acyl-carrier-protein] S-malonyltransferase
MRDAGIALTESLAAANFSEPDITVVAASDAAPYTDGDNIRQRLSAQVYSPVRWVATVNAMIEAGSRSVVECGPGKVLTGLMRRIDKTIPATCIETTESLQQALQN